MARRTKGVRDPILRAWFSLLVAWGLLVGDALGVFALSNTEFIAILALVYLIVLGRTSKKILSRLLSAWTARH
jgi:hypothetical protein